VQPGYFHGPPLATRHVMIETTRDTITLLPPHHSTMPKTMPTPCMDTLRRFMTEGLQVRLKLFLYNNISKSVSFTMPTSKLLIFFVILVRDQEVGGSNPLAPTKFLKDLQTLNNDIRLYAGSTPLMGRFPPLNPGSTPPEVRRGYRRRRLSSVQTVTLFSCLMLGFPIALAYPVTYA
jgi:hypothetical protein